MFEPQVAADVVNSNLVILLFVAPTVSGGFVFGPDTWIEIYCKFGIFREGFILTKLRRWEVS